MTTRSRYFYIIYLLAGLVISLNSIAGLSSSDNRTPVGHIVQIAFGIAMVAIGACAYLYPDKTSSPTVARFAGVGSLMLASVVIFFLIHFYGITGFFSTGDSMTGLGSIIFLLIMSILLFFRPFPLWKK